MSDRVTYLRFKLSAQVHRITVPYTLKMEKQAIRHHQPHYKVEEKVQQYTGFSVQNIFTSF